MHDMDDFLALEIKKEIADRYFGFRKMIEDDSRQYNQHIRDAYRQLENEVGFDLIRLYILLGRETQVHDFFRLTGLRDQTFLDPYLSQSPTIRRRLFKGQTIHGFTRKARFRNLFLDIYNRVQAGLAAYITTCGRLIEEGKAIGADIENFHRTNDLGIMMDFLRRMGNGSSQQEGPLLGDLTQRSGGGFEERMRLRAPANAETLLPLFQPLPPVKSCRSALIDLIDRAFDVQGRPEVTDFAR